MRSEKFDDYQTLDDLEVAGKTVLVRCDMNVPIDPATKQILETYKIEAHKETLHELSSRGARVVVMSHQARPGEPDFVNLEPHSKVLSKVMGKPVKFVNDIHGEKAKKSIRELKNGDILLLDNVRFSEEENKKGNAEQHSKTKFVQDLAAVADLYVCDAFGVCHRDQPSVTGFPLVIDSAIARLMAKELVAIDKINDNPTPPMGYLLGGIKLEEVFLIMENSLKKGTADYMFLGSVPGIIFLKAKGINIGKANEDFLASRKYSDLHTKAKELLNKYGDKIYMPVDFAVEKGGKRHEVNADKLPDEYSVKDIGSKTVEEYSRIINSLNTIFVNGPVGLFEDERFGYGTENLFKGIANSKAYSVLGGGHTTAAIRKWKITGFNHVSSGGGVVLNILAGERLPVMDIIGTKRK